MLAVEVNNYLETTIIGECTSSNGKRLNRQATELFKGDLLNIAKKFLPNQRRKTWMKDEILMPKERGSEEYSKEDKGMQNMYKFC